MLNIGCHLSLSKGFAHMGKEALSINANTFQFFTRNPRGGAAKEIDPKDAAALTELTQEHNFAPLLAHAPYTLNLCSAKEESRNYAKQMMEEDLIRLEQLPCHLYNFHPGSHTTQEFDLAVSQITDALNEVIQPGQKTTMLLETMAGKGSEIGRTFEQLQQIIECVLLKEHMGICLDTCHVYDAGYDIVNDLDGVLTHFDQTIGLKYLKAIHLNDSKNPFASHKDRHEKIGEGSLGLQTFINIINHPKLCHLPFFLETPNEVPGYKEEITLLKSHYRA